MSAAKGKKRIFIKILLFFCYFILFIAIAIVFAAVAVLNMTGKDLPNVELLAKFEPSETTRIYAADGSQIATLFRENRSWVPLDQIPKSMKDAIVASEDSRFYQHHGVDPKGIVRSILADLKGGGARQGASTITMQLAREIFLHPQKSLHRKIQESIIAMQIERRFTKSEILERYLNQIYFGSGAYGIEAAAQNYFGKHAKQLDLAESAMIAGLPPAPSIYSPFVDRESAHIRQGLVLKRMVECGYITQDEANAAGQENLKYAEHKTELQSLKYPYFTTYVLKQLAMKYSDDLLYRGGLKIYTTLDPKMQEIAKAAMRRGFQKAVNENMDASTGALVALDPKTGYIRAMVGGLNYTEKNQFNRAWQAKRQPGSSFKPIVYTAAIDTGYNPYMTIVDAPIGYRLGDGVVWAPQNSDRKFAGALTIRDALKWSRNVPAVKLMEKVGIDAVLDYAARLGIHEPLEPMLSVALGSCTVTPLELASLYAVFPAGGMRYEPTAIKVIFDSSGNVIEDHRWPQPEEVIAESTAFTMVEMLRTVIESGTGYSANIGRPAAGKTGTTDEFRDAWFVGFTPELSCAVWAGNDDNHPMNHVYGGDLPAPIWADFMRNALAETKSKEFFVDKSGMVSVAMCAESGARATGSCPNIVKRTFSPRVVPQNFCPIHGPIKYNSRTGKIERVAPEAVKPEPSATKEQPRRSESEPRPADVQPDAPKQEQPQSYERPHAIQIPKVGDVKGDTITIPKVDENVQPAEPIQIPQDAPVPNEDDSSNNM